MNRNLTRKATVFPVLGTLLITLLFSCLATATDDFPQETWKMYENPQDAGFSSEELGKARQYWESIDSAAAFLVHDGKVVVAWGDYERRFLLHSVRKSIMSGVYGIHVDSGHIDTLKTLADLGIDDQNFSLNEIEKQARIIDLIRARSGVYHLAAAEPPQNPKPERGAFAPGKNWCYNNWDFNALCTILEQEIETKFFEEVDKYFALPLQMQDYRPRHGMYQFEPDKSIHPAYHIRMSARDMARFGLLYLNNGNWDGTQILSEKWVNESGSAFSDDAWGGGYGYMWWVSFTEPFRELKMYSALGVGNQSIDVIPGANLVFVNRANTFDNERVTNDEREELIRLLLLAQTDAPVLDPKLIDLPGIKREWQPVELSQEEKEALTVDPIIPSLTEIALQDGKLVLHSGANTFDLIVLPENKIMIDDIYKDLFLVKNQSNVLQRIINEGSINTEGYRLLTAGQVDKAIETFQLGVKYYPKSLNVYDSLADAYLAGKDFEAALDCFQKVLEMNPGDVFTLGRIQEVELLQNPGKLDE